MQASIMIKEVINKLILPIFFHAYIRKK